MRKHQRALKSTIHTALSATLALPLWGYAQNASVPRPFIEEQHQQARERLLREQQERSVDVRLPTGTEPHTARLAPSEAPCSVVARLALEGEQSTDFEWSLDAANGDRADDSPVGLCLGAQGIETVVARVQKAIVDRGYITTRVLAGRQDLSSGTLTLTLIPGRISAVRFAPENVPTTNLRNAIPAKAGDLLQLHDLEQGLENLKRLPTADADIQVEPSTAAGARPGDSDLVVKYGRKLPCGRR